MPTDPQPRQLCALTFAAFTVPAVLYLPRAGWLWALVAAGGAALLLGGLLRLQRGRPLAEAALFAWGGMGRVLLTLSLVWTLLLLGAAARGLCGAYPEGKNWPLVGLLLLLLASYAAERGVLVVARTGAICFFFLAAIEALVLLFSAVQGHAAWLKPDMSGPPWALMTAALSPTCVLYLTRGGVRRRWPWLIAGVALATAAAMCTAATLSPAVAQTDAFPFYTMTQSISVLGVMERFEPVVSAALTAGGFCMLALLCLSNGAILRALGWRLPVGPVNFLLGAGAMWLSRGLPDWVTAAGTAIFWGLLPLATLLVGSLKKSGKNEKKC